MNAARLHPSSARAIGVVVPAHNEEELLPAALQALERSLAAATVRHVMRGVVVVLDACTDNSDRVAQEWRRHMREDHRAVQVRIVECGAKNVGIARARGFADLLKMWGEVDAQHIWLATTDADSRVPADWLATQLRARDEGAALWTGRVRVSDWAPYDSTTRSDWSARYEAEDFPIHGASLGCSALAYLEVGGFPPLATGEDRALCQLMAQSDARWTHDSTVRVVTSGRRVARAPDGFSFALARIEAAGDLGTRDSLLNRVKFRRSGGFASTSVIAKNEGTNA